MRGGIEVRVNDRIELNLTLEGGAATEGVTVTGETPLLATSTASMGQVVDARRMAELPIAHGQPFALVGLVPGVSFNAGAATLNRPFESTHIAGCAMSGVRTNRSDITIDGVPSTATASEMEVISTHVPPADIVQELRVQTATFDAQFGNTQGDQVRHQRSPRGGVLFQMDPRTDGQRLVQQPAGPTQAVLFLQPLGSARRRSGVASQAVQRQEQYVLSVGLRGNP